MSIAKQAAANRRNARRSRGPRSSAGKQRVSHNARRHGLSISITADRAFGEQIEQLAREIAGDTQNELRLECARAVAAAELDLARVRQAKVALIERVMASGALRALAREVQAQEAPAMPSAELCRSAEAIKRALPALVKFDRYEQRARAARDRAVRQLGIVEVTWIST
jgi:prophage DNA circulation protein